MYVQDAFLLYIIKWLYSTLSPSPPPYNVSPYRDARGTAASIFNTAKTDSMTYYCLNLGYFLLDFF